MTDETKPDFNKTRAELMKENALLRAQLEGKTPEPAAPTEDVEALKAELTELRGLQADRAGWLITTKNILYDGVTHGVKFEAGMAYIPANARFPKYRQTPLKEGYKEMNKISDKDWAKMLERAKRSEAEVVVELITKDLRGYTARFYPAEEQKALQTFMDARRQEFQVALSQANDSAARALTTPGFVGA